MSCCRLLLQRQINVLNLIPASLFSTTSCCFGRKSRTPYDKRFPISPKDVGPHKKFGSLKVVQDLGKAYGRAPAPGYYDDRGIFHRVEEMVPEFVVPNLSGFALKPYVSYRVPDVIQSEFTAKDLFDSVYSPQIIDDHRKGKLQDPKSYINKEME